MCNMHITCVSHGLQFSRLMITIALLLLVASKFRDLRKSYDGLFWIKFHLIKSSSMLTSCALKAHRGFFSFSFSLVSFTLVFVEFISIAKLIQANR